MRPNHVVHHPWESVNLATEFATRAVTHHHHHHHVPNPRIVARVTTAAHTYLDEGLEVSHHGRRLVEGLHQLEAGRAGVRDE